MQDEIMNILGISGSLREQSLNTKLIRIAQRVAPEGVTVTQADLSDIPPYNNDDYEQGFPTAVTQLRDAIAHADALLIATPEYNFSTSGVLKNAIDWVSRPPDHPFDGKPIALAGAAAGAMGTSRAQYHLRQIFVFLNGHILNKPEVTIAGAHNHFNDTEELADEATVARVKELVDSLTAWATRLRA